MSGLSDFIASLAPSKSQSAPEQNKTNPSLSGSAYSTYNNVTNYLNDQSRWGLQGGGYHSTEYDKPVSAVLGNAAEGSNDVGDIKGQYAGLEDMLFKEDGELKEGRAKPNHNMSFANDSWLMNGGWDKKKRLEQEGVDYYDPVLGAADVWNGWYQNLANSRRIANGTTDDRVEYGKTIDGVEWKENDLKNAKVGFDIDGVFLDADNLPGADDEVNVSADGKYVQMKDGNWVPTDALRGLDDSLAIAKSGGKRANLDELNNTKVDQLGKTWWNTADSSDGNPINFLLDIFDKDDGSSSDVQFDASHIPAFLYDAAVGSLPYFFWPTMAATIGSRAILAANGYDPDSYDLSDGTYDDYKLNNKDRLLSIASSVGEGVVERLGGIGAAKGGKGIIEETLGPLGPILDKSLPGRVVKTGYEEGVEEIPTETLGYIQDVNRTNEDGSDYYDDIDDPVADFAIRHAQAFGGGASMGAALGLPREIKSGIQKQIMAQKAFEEFQKKHENVGKDVDNG